MDETTGKPPLSRYEALMLVVEAYGSQEAAAAALGVFQSTVSRWTKQSRQLPAEHVLQAERDTGISRHLLRPDIYPLDLPPAPRWYGLDQRVDRYEAAVRFNRARPSKRGAAA